MNMEKIRITITQQNQHKHLGENSHHPISLRLHRTSFSNLEKIPIQVTRLTPKDRSPRVNRAWTWLSPICYSANAIIFMQFNRYTIMIEEKGPFMPKDGVG